MYRFFVPYHQINETEGYIEGDDVNHIRNVLRMRPGEHVVLSDGRGYDYICQLGELLPSRICCSVLEKRAAISELPVKITLFQALPKKDKMELIIQKAVELGVSRIVPVQTKRCVAKLSDKKKAEKKQARWQAIAESAAKQSGRGYIPEVSEAISFNEACSEAAALDFVMVPYELCETMQGSFEAVKKAAASKSVGVFIGPEGGFERGEVEKLIANGAVEISLGKRILRTETAGLTVLSVLMFLIEANYLD
ncbi:MAG: 16S rRNA (uracil(1498)-N(3))-methyltransferase [Lachnospiraceae bacterium]|nr:16S rRNA (uracil(1498)-N(3))-methyltransferase [Lachnospiraceae bacterium]